MRFLKLDGERYGCPFLLSNINILSAGKFTPSNSVELVTTYFISDNSEYNFSIYILIGSGTDPWWYITPCFKQSIIKYLG